MERFVTDPENCGLRMIMMNSLFTGLFFALADSWRQLIRTIIDHIIGNSLNEIVTAGIQTVLVTIIVVVITYIVVEFTRWESERDARNSNA